MRPSEAIRALGLAAGVALAALPALADAPQRVVSMNLCTDQLALMLAAPGQLISVSDVARDPLTSPMAEAAHAFPVNHGGAEQIYLLDPDLVLASIYSNPAAIDMLRRLGIRVEQLDIVQSLDEVPERVAEMGALLGRETEADAIIARYEADLAALDAPPDGPRAAFYYPNGYTLGTGTMSDQILTRAGFRNIADELTTTAAGRVALELLVMADPSLVVSSANYAGTSRSEAILSHPALQSVIAAGQGHISTADWVCGTPHVVRAIRDLAETRAQLAAP